MNFYYLSGIYMWILVIATSVSLGIVIFLWYLRKYDDYWEKRGVPFYPRQSFLAIYRMLKNKTLIELLLEPYRKYGRVFGGFLYRKPMLIVGDPDLIRDLLVKDFHIFGNRQQVNLNDPMIDNMVSVLRGEDWKRVRTIITPAFTSKQMRKMGNIINDCSEVVVKILDEHFQKEESVDCKELFGAFTIDTIALAAFATKINSMKDKENIFVKMTKKMFEELSVPRILFLSLLPQRLLVWLRIAGLKSMDFFKEVVLQVIKERKDSGQKYEDFLQSLLDTVNEDKSSVEGVKPTAEDDSDQYGSVTSTAVSSPAKYKRTLRVHIYYRRRYLDHPHPNPTNISLSFLLKKLTNFNLSEDELVAQCVLFFSVGYETTAATLAYVAYALATNPEWQDKLADEVDEAFQKHEKMSYDAVRDMKILDAVVSETLRMYPPVMRTERTALKEYKLGNTGIVVEKGMSVVIQIYPMHYDPEFFPDPDKFNPERFMNTSLFKHPQYSYLPFGAGPRNCLGMRFALLEIKLCIANVLRHYKFKVCSTTKVPLELKKTSAFLSVTELPLGLEKRQ